MTEPQPDRPTDARSRLLSHFSSATGSSEHGKKWDDLYAEGFLPWDKGFPNPALVDLLNEREDLLPPPKEEKRMKALVPGCGRGYDVLLLASMGFDAWGLEISPRALEEAREIEKELMGKGVYKAREGVRAGDVGWVSGDFFAGEWLKDVKGCEGGFDLIYDYTFLCALPPSMRPAWSKRFNELLSPTGRVVCVEFPTYKPPSTGGPPWALPPKVYLAHLPRPGLELPYDGEGNLQEEDLGEPCKDGLKRIAHFQPKRTHEIGCDAEGKVTDWVSVWTH